MCWHDALPPALFVTLQRDAAKLIEHGSRTYWLDADCSPAPQCALEQFALSVLFSHRQRCGAEDVQFCGVEWWVQQRHLDGSADATIALHWDTDEELKSASGEHVPPWLATVTYLEDHGAPTLVVPLAANRHGRSVPLVADAATRCGGAFLSYPRCGKHMAFDGRLLHGAPHALAAPLPAATAQARTTLLVNLWLAHRPTGLRRLPAELAAELTPAAGVAGAGARDAADATAVLTLADGGAVATVEPADVDASGDERVSLEAARVGYPFYHPPVWLHGLPSPHSAAARDCSLAYVPPERLDMHVGAAPAACASAV